MAITRYLDIVDRRLDRRLDTLDRRLEFTILSFS